MKIGSFEIGSAPFLIAEASINHNGDLDRACNMIDVAKYSGADCCKFQTYRTEDFCRPNDPMFDTFKRCELPSAAWQILKDRCDRAEIVFLSTPQNRSDLDILLPLGMQAIKVGSDDFCNLPLLKDYASVGLPMILSTGMAHGEDIAEVWLSCNGNEIAWLVCTSQYPTKPGEVNVQRVSVMNNICEDNFITGFSDHTIGNTASIMAVALGAVIFERHFTLDHSLPGPEHSWACNPVELKSWVDAVNEAWVMRGAGSFELSEREKENKRKYQRQVGQQLRGMA